MDNRYTSASRAKHVIGAVLAAILLAGCAALVRPNYTQSFSAIRAGEFSLDPEHAFVLFKVDHLGLSKIVGRFNAVQATLDFDPASPQSLELDARVQMNSIDLGNQKLERRLRGSQWLNTERFPEARFTTTSVDVIGTGRLKVSGEFDWRDVQSPLVLDVRFNGAADNLLTGKYTVGFSAGGTLRRSDYGVDGFAALVGDAVDIEIHAEFQRN